MEFSLKQFEVLLRLMVPYVVLAALVLVSQVKFPIASASLIKPYLILMFIYYWSIYRPTLVPPSLCFAVGLLVDSLSTLPLGLNAIIFIAVRWIMSDQRRFLMGQPYTTVWAVFAFVVLAVCLSQWALLGFVQGAWAPLTEHLVVAAVSLFVFPFISLLLVGVHKILPVSTRVKV